MNDFTCLGNSGDSRHSAWAVDRVTVMRSSRLAGWAVAAAASLVALLQAAALLLPIPLKRIDTEGLLVDTRAGSVEALKDRRSAPGVPLAPPAVAALHAARNR